MNKYALVVFHSEYSDEYYNVYGIEKVFLLDENLQEVSMLGRQRQEIIELANKYIEDYYLLPPDPILLDLESGKLLLEVLLERANIESR